MRLCLKNPRAEVSDRMLAQHAQVPWFNSQHCKKKKNLNNKKRNEVLTRDNIRESQKEATCSVYTRDISL
jgi:hypothetical protein